MVINIYIITIKFLLKFRTHFLSIWGMEIWRNLLSGEIRLITFQIQLYQLMQEKIQHSLCHSKDLQSVIGKFFPVPLSFKVCTSVLALEQQRSKSQTSNVYKRTFLSRIWWIFNFKNIIGSIVHISYSMDLMLLYDVKKGNPRNKKSGTGLFDSLTSVLELSNVVTDWFKKWLSCS